MRRKAARGIAVTTLLVCAGLLLSGCWAKVSVIGGKYKTITLTQDLTRRLISTCTADTTSGKARDFCVLDRVNGVCRTFPETGVTEDDCYALANYANYEDLDFAIKMVNFYGGCLELFVNTPPCEIDCYPNHPTTWVQSGLRSGGDCA